MDLQKFVTDLKRELAEMPRWRQALDEREATLRAMIPLVENMIPRDTPGEELAPTRPVRASGQKACQDCGRAVGPMTLRCRPCFTEFNRGRPRKSRSGSARDQKTSKCADQRLKEFKQSVRSGEPPKASCGVCVIRIDNGNRFLAKQPGCPVHGIKTGPLASSLGGQEISGKGVMS